jgi:alpha-beta hydrolase superfamily lysophospholipase
MKMFLIILAVLVVVIVITFLLGPKERVGPFTAFDPARLGPDVEAALASSEAQFGDIRNGLQKEIIWRDPETRAKTPLAIVYIHGFSAAKSETRPLPDLVAEALNTNVFYTRLAGHGRTGAAMAEATANDWLEDAAEAIEVGRQIGEKVLIIATSTGATTAAFGAIEPSMRRDVAGMVFISPNFGVRASGSEYLTIPWSRHLVPLVLGRERDFTSDNPDYNHGWTTSYPMVSLVPMMALVQHVRTLPFADTDVPVMMLHAPDDQVVNTEESQKVFEKWGGSKVWVDVPGTRGATHHVIAGDIVNPAMTEPLAAKVIEWARDLRD